MAPPPEQSLRDDRSRRLRLPSCRGHFVAPLAGPDLDLEVSVRCTGHLSAIFEEARARGIVERPLKGDRAIDPVDHPLTRFAGLAIGSMDLRVVEPDVTRSSGTALRSA